MLSRVLLAAGRFTFSENVRRTVFGGPTWRPAVADYDGDGEDERGIYRRSDGVWKYRETSTNAWVTTGGYGGASWLPAPGNYDGE